MDGNEHVLDLIAEYVLGSLSAAEVVRVQQHLANCAVCQAEARDYETVLLTMAEGVPQAAPPPGLRTRLLASVVPSEPPAVRVLRPPTLWEFFQKWRIPAFAGVGVILVLVVSNLLLWQQVKALQTTALETAMLVEPLHAVDMTAPATGLVVMDPHGEYGTIIVDSLPPSAEGEQYQVWLRRGTQVDSGGVFTIWENGYGAQVIYAPEPLIVYEKVWITIEPHGGSEQPSGPAVLRTQP